MPRPELVFHCICNFHSYHAADEVMKVMSGLTNVRLEVESRVHEMSESDKNNGVGDWAVGTYDDGGSDGTYRLSSCCELAMQIVLADSLREHVPHHPLLQQWVFRPENRDKIVKSDYQVTIR